MRPAAAILAVLLAAPLSGCPGPGGSGGATIANSGGSAKPRLKRNDLVILDSLDWSAKYLEAHGLKLGRNGGSLHLKVSGTDRTATTLAGALQAVRRRMTVIRENVVNAETTHLPSAPAGSAKQPYRRKELVVGPRGELEVVETPGDFRKAYRPGHPDAAEDGRVLLPNVYVEVEMADWRSSLREYEILRLALAALSDRYVAPPAGLLAEPRPPAPYEAGPVEAPKPAKTEATPIPVPPGG